MIQGKDIIYVNGDSFAQGCDIADHLYPGFKKNFSLNELRSKPIQQALDDQFDSIKYKNKFQTENYVSYLGFLAYERNFRWSSRLEAILNKPVMNISSHGGSSMYAIAYRTISDVIHLQNSGYNITDVIIQITSGSRHSIFKNTELHEQPSGPGQYRHSKYNIISFNRNTVDKDQYVELAEQLSLHEQPEFTEYRALHDLLMLKSSLASLTKARIILVDSVFYKQTIGEVKLFELDKILEENSHIVQFKKQLDQEIELSMLECIDPDEPDTMTAGMHFTAKVHDIFANKIAERYFQ